MSRKGGVRFTPNAPIWALLAIEPRPTTSHLVCSFCGVEVDKTTATHGTGRMSGMINIRSVDEVAKTFEDRAIPQVDRVVACRQCVLQVEIVTFPDTDG